jgi:SAM-dependent methyltransferase
VKRDFYAEYFELEDRHWWFVGRRRIFLSFLNSHLPPRPDGARRILDVGCGTGTMIGHLRRYGEVSGVDPSPEAVSFCRERGIEGVSRLDGLPLPFDDGRFDLVTAFDVIEHIDDDTATLRDLRRVLRPDGRLLVSVPAFRFLWGPQDEISEHKRRYTAGELAGRLRAADFSVLRLTYFNTLLFPPIAAIRLLRPYQPGSADLRSDFTMTRSRWQNRLLGGAFGLEAGLVRRTRLPFGVSILAWAAPA